MSRSTWRPLIFTRTCIISSKTGSLLSTTSVRDALSRQKRSRRSCFAEKCVRFATGRSGTMTNLANSLRETSTMNEGGLDDSILICPDARDSGTGTYDTKRMKLAKDVAAFLLTNDYIFDKNSPYYLTDVQVRRLVKEKMMTRAFEKLDFKAHVLEFKAKMSENTK